jgi:hypothetical protein
MVMYLTKFIGKEYFDVGVTTDVESIITDKNYDLDLSFYYEGSDDDLDSLSNVIKQLFKKYIVEDVFFDFEHFNKIIEFIEYQANNYGFEISEKKILKEKLLWKV